MNSSPDKTDETNASVLASIKDTPVTHPSITEAIGSLNQLRDQLRAEKPTCISEAELYKFKYLVQCGINAQMRRDSYLIEMRRADQDFNKNKLELKNFYTELSDRYNMSFGSDYGIDDSGFVIPLSANGQSK